VRIGGRCVRHGRESRTRIAHVTIGGCKKGCELAVLDSRVAINVGRTAKATEQLVREDATEVGVPFVRSRISTRRHDRSDVGKPSESCRRSQRSSIVVGNRNRARIEISWTDDTLGVASVDHQMHVVGWELVEDLVVKKSPS
jgi:hypothetical protein